METETQPRTASAEPTPTTATPMYVFETLFDPESITVVTQANIFWKAGGDSGEVATATATDPPRAIPLFGGTTGVYTVSVDGTLLSISESVPDADYYIYKGAVGGTVRGRINVKRTK